MARSDGALRDSELTYEIIGASQKVHRALGPGFPETVYHKALCQELVSGKVAFESEKQYEVYYQGFLCGQFRAAA